MLWVSSWKLCGVFALLLLLSACVDKFELPEGWRTPNNVELEDRWRNVDNNKYIKIWGDFNGDGTIDEARLLVRNNPSSLGLFAFVSQPNHSYKSYFLDEMKGNIAIHAMGIRIVASGIYKTACGKGYWKCSNGETPEIVIKNEAIDYFKTESANSFFYWDSATNKFNRIWISD